MTLVATGGAIAILVAIAINPNIAINPFPPITVMPSPSPFPTGTAVQTAVSHSPTPMPTPIPMTPLLPSPTRIQPATLTPSATPERAFAAVTMLDALPDCDTIGVAGTVSDIEGEPLIGYPVHVWGPGIEQVVLSGSASTYGDSSWEVTVPNQQIRFKDTWYVQLHLRNVFRRYPAVSPIITVDLSTNCEENLMLIHFQEREE